MVDKGATPVVTVEKENPPEALGKVTMKWNGVVDGLILARKNWEEMQLLLLDIPRDQIQLAPIQVQKASARFRKATFSVMLSRLADYYRAFGGLEAMKVKGAKEDGQRQSGKA
jgi:hypothetical protein